MYNLNKVTLKATIKVLESFKYWSPFMIIKDRPNGFGQETVVTYGDIIDENNKLKREYEPYKSQIGMLENATDEFLNKQVVEAVSNAVNRSQHQTKELFALCDHDLPKYLKLEEKLKNTFTFWSPGDKEAVEYVLKLENKVNRFKFKDHHFEGDKLVLIT